MSQKFKQLMLEQLQEYLQKIAAIAIKPTPQKGWIRTIREALGMSSAVLGERLGTSRSNITLLEQREQKGTIRLDTLEKTAQTLNCKLVYFFIPIESFDKQLEDQAKKIAKKQIRAINHSMKLEQQGLTGKQLQKQEEDLIKELLKGNPKNLWNSDV